MPRPTLENPLFRFMTTEDANAFREEIAAAGLRYARPRPIVAAAPSAIGRTTGSGSAPRRPQTSGTRSGCCDPAPSQHDATLLVHCMHGRRQMTATRRPVMGSVVTIGSVRMSHPLSQRGSGQGINLARFGQPSLFKSPGRRFGSRANILRAAFRCQSRRFP